MTTEHPMELIDTHCHLDEATFEHDCGDVVNRAVESGVVAMVTIGTTTASSRLAVALAQVHAPVYAVVGIQPNYVSDATAADWAAIEELAAHPKVVAIGETGLDRYWDFAPFELQVEFFDRHLELARRLDLPFVVHCRDAEFEVVARLRVAAERGPLRGVMHSFCGTIETARSCWELGLHISFSGMLTYKKNDALRQTAAQVPEDRLLVETDAPYLAPAPKRGKRNEPAFVLHTATRLAEVHAMPLERMAALTTQNARALFGLPTNFDGQPALLTSL